MKTFILTVSLVLTSCLIKAQQGDVFGVLSYSPGTCKVTVEYWIKNPTSGAGSFDIAISRVNLQWDSSLLNFISFTSFTDGLNKTPDHWSGNSSDPAAPDTVINGSRVITDYVSAINGTDTTYTYSQQNYQTKLIQRSTDSCNNILKVLGGESKPILSAVFQFKNCDSANNYNFFDPNASNFIGDFANTTDTISQYKKILFVLDRQSRPNDPSGVNCPPGTKIKSLNNIPIGADSASFVNSQGPLPVKLLYLAIYKQNNKAALQWETATELDNYGFEVQRKTNKGFETIGFVASKTDNGYSQQNIKYNFTDPELLITGTSYYRLRQLGYSKTQSYSEIKSIRNNSKSLQVLVYPNPANGLVNVIIPEGNGTIDINLVDFSGKLIKTWNSYRGQNLQLRNLRTGIYSLQISNRETGEKTSQKLTVL
ncbi:MAG: T9SS type A sorting domain-containing protein [Sphingobacteriales bacterium]